MKQDRKHFKPKQTETILDSISDGVFTVDMDWLITSFNKAAETITGIEREEAIGHQCCDVFKANICENECALRQTLKTGVPIINKAIYIVNADGDRIPISISTGLLKDEDDQLIGGVETFRDLSLVEELKKEIEGRYRFADILSQNPHMQKMFEILPEVALSDAPVLIEGETGTGKELFANAIHNLSNRKSFPFIAVNCGALPETLLESELFGYKAGAFTDAKKDKKGRFALASKGTLFLDEVGDISSALQVKLLRVLQEKMYEPLGSTKQEKADVRIITAANQDLEQLIHEGKFRQDFFYRINVITLQLPPLRARKEDIPILIEHFISHFNSLQNKNILGVSESALALLMAHNYPGNVRELENIIERAFVMCHGDLIRTKNLPESIKSLQPYMHNAKEKALTLKELEKIHILEALEHNMWNRLATARELGINKSTLFRKIKFLKIKLPRHDGRSSSVR
ncbi:MAG: Fis family transcriptional regulator [Candidatus Schekmanbacteria bacterium RBG_13_48_7]|uniref:Fis family transcriptional regulator n=1 Tax=Candidatus Schekmanbacteria bacterium RBG_13_48_7 TaxID=1817878 RepID=A0A1F7RW98_9BACT|nr:MAG: Fis family transcriptional regulator [Candidatus Schekmanbacteria bacterium RBG_13_48_7]